jgi:anti-anti-sigma regulatory factor
MTTAIIDATGYVGCAHLADGMLVALSGALTDELLPGLRQTLLRPYAETCRDVVVDAGEVIDLTDGVLAVLVAARAWAGAHGRRFLLSRSCQALDEALEAMELTSAFHRLEPLGGEQRSALSLALPMPRSATD